MNTRERFVRTLLGQETDRVPFISVFGGYNQFWKPEIITSINECIGFEGKGRGWTNPGIDYSPANQDTTEILEEDETRRVEKRGDGSIVVFSKSTLHNFYHTAKYAVNGKESWAAYKERHLQIDLKSRFPDNWTEYSRSLKDRDYPASLHHGGVYGFARMLIGDEALAYMFYDDPELVHDIIGSYTDMTLAIWAKAAEDVQFDLIECWEDMAYNGGSIVSPHIFKEFLRPYYQKIRQFANEHGIKIVMVDSDGYIENMAGWLMGCGVNVIYPFEVQAGNDILRASDTYTAMGALGGLDKNAISQSRNAIDRELERAGALIRHGRIIPGPDHFPIEAEWDEYRYFYTGLRQVIMDTKPAVFRQVF